MPNNQGQRVNKSLPILSVILSVACAIALWLYVVSVEDPTYTKTFDGVMVEVKNENILTGGGLAVMSGKGVRISVTVRGRRSDINRYSDDDIAAYIDVGEISEASRTPVRIQTEVPDGLVVTGTSSNSIEVYVDKPFSKVIPIDQNIKVDGYIHSDEYDIGRVTIRPDSILSKVTEITIDGPQSTLNAIVGARVKDVNLGNAVVDRAFKANITSELEFYSVDESGEKIVLEKEKLAYVKIPGSGEVSLNIPVTLKRTLPITVEFSDNSDSEDYTVEYSPKEIAVRGEVSIMDTYIANNGFKLSLEGNRKKYVGTHEYTIPMDTTIEMVSDARDSDFSDGIKVSVTVTEKKKAEG